MKRFSAEEALFRAELADERAENAEARIEVHTANMTNPHPAFPRTYEADRAERCAGNVERRAKDAGDAADRYLRDEVQEHGEVAKLYAEAARIEAEACRRKAAIYRQAANVARRGE